MTGNVSTGALVGASAGQDCLAGAGKLEHIVRRRAPASRICLEHGGKVLSVPFIGRVLQTLLKLIAAGRHGVTAWDFPDGARVAHYVCCLRQIGIPVETETESHEGRAGGMHARYRLAPGVRVKAEAA